jgi:hypothetical protein
MNDNQSEIQELIRQWDRDRLTLAHRINIANKAKEPTPEFLDMIARHPEYVADHQRPSSMIVPRDLKFTLHKGMRVIKTALLRADIIEYKDGGESPAYVSINYPALFRLFPEVQDKPWRSKRSTIEFEQHRCPAILSDCRDDDELTHYMQNVENVLVYFMAQNGMDGRKLYRDADGQAVMPREPGVKQNSVLRDVYHKAVTYQSFAGHGASDGISFGVITRNVLPHFCNLIELYFRHDEATRQATTFAFPVLDIGKMRFVNNGPDEGAQYQRVVQVQGRDVVKQETVTTGEWLRHEMCEMLAGPMREMEIIPNDFLGKFFTMVDEIRSVITEAGPFNPHHLSPVHEAVIPRLQ